MSAGENGSERLVRHAVALGYIAEGELPSGDLDALRARLTAEQWAELERVRSELDARGETVAVKVVRGVVRADSPTVTTDPSRGEDDDEPEGPSLPTRIGPYEVLGELGRGGMGVVFRARHVELEREVAIKVLRSGSTAGTQQRERFRLEARAAARLRHPNLVAIHDVGEAEETPYLVMDLIDGEPLDEQLERQGVLDPTEAARLCAKVARALHYVHANTLVHRDLKPANILVTPEGEPLLTDFGLAKHLDVEAGSGLTNSGQLVGTPSYMAPEQAHGGLLDARTDVYGLGATLYALLTGDPPFDGSSVLEIVGKLVKAEPERPTTARGSRVPKDLETICLTCLEKEPARRYATAEELALDLERFSQGESIAARPPNLLRREWDAIRKNRPTSWVTNLAVVVFALVLCYALVVVDRRRRMSLHYARLDARNPATRVAAAEALGAFPEGQVITWLLEAACLDEHAQVRAAAQQSLLKVLPQRSYQAGLLKLPPLLNTIPQRGAEEQARLWMIARGLAPQQPPPPAADDVAAWTAWWETARQEQPRD